MVRVFISDIRNLPDALDEPKVMEGLPNERKEKVLRIKRLTERKQSLGAGLLLEYSKRQVADNEELCYNLSHSGDYVLCAVSKNNIGCDLEKIEKAPLKVAARYFCPEEVAYLNQLDEIQRNEEFYRIWTIKESYLKMIGKGLSAGLSSFQVNFDQGVVLLKEDNLVDCFIKEYNLPGYKVSICSKDKCLQEDLEFIDL